MGKASRKQLKQNAARSKVGLFPHRKKCGNSSINVEQNPSEHENYNQQCEINLLTGSLMVVLVKLYTNNKQFELVHKYSIC